MSNTFIPQAVEIVKQAIEADGAGEYEKALPLYRRSLEYFMTGLKYEQNPAGEREQESISTVFLWNILEGYVLVECRGLSDE